MTPLFIRVMMAPSLKDARPPTKLYRLQSSEALWGSLWTENTCLVWASHAPVVETTKLTRCAARAVTSSRRHPCETQHWPAKTRHITRSRYMIWMPGQRPATMTDVPISTPLPSCSVLVDSCSRARQAQRGRDTSCVSSAPLSILDILTCNAFLRRVPFQQGQLETPRSGKGGKSVLLLVPTLWLRNTFNSSSDKWSSLFDCSATASLEHIFLCFLLSFFAHPGKSYGWGHE